MKLLRNIAVTFSLYSRIPMPVFEWKDDDIKHNLVFLPMVGLVIGVLIALMRIFLPEGQAAWLLRAALSGLIPLIITGGFHVDGFMDVQDALRSYKPKEEKLKIMKDPHIGAFAVIAVLKLVLFWACALTVIMTADIRYTYVFGCCFFVSRTLCGITSLTFPHAKKEGMLDMETKKTGRGDVYALAVLFCLGAAIMLFFDIAAGAAAIFSAVIYTLFYRFRCMKEFGGVTGDTAGYFLVECETVMAFILGSWIMFFAN